MKLSLLRIIGLALALPLSASAVNILVNGSFETGAFVDTGGGYNQLFVGNTSMTGWTVVGTQIVRGGTPNVDSIVAPNGSYFLDLTSYGAQGAGNSGVTQTIATTIGASYHFSITLFNPIDAAPIGVNVVTGGSTTVLSGLGVKGFDFVATGTSTPIAITQQAGVFFVGVDNLSVDANGVPDHAATLPLLSFSLLLLHAIRRKTSA